ncbi:hypothetical protein Tco_1269092 [Tanacetum coccineum]
MHPSPLVKQKVHWCKEILQQKGKAREFWASCGPYNDQCDGGDVPSNEEKKSYRTCMNDDERIDKDCWRKDLMKVSECKDENLIDKEPNIGCTQEENSYATYYQGNSSEDQENLGDKKRELILDVVEDRLSDDWFTCITDDVDDLDCMVDYLELQSLDDFVDIKDEAISRYI